MMFIVPPQEYYEHPHKYSSFLDAYHQRFLAFEPNHLWFLEFLIVFMVFAIPVAAWLKSSASKFVLSGITRLAQYRLGLFLLVTLLIAVRCWLQSTTLNEGHGIDNLALSAFYGLFSCLA